MSATLNGAGFRVCVVAARCNELSVKELVTGATEGLRRLGVGAEDIDVVRPPGAFEVPALVRRAALSERYDAVIALGCVIRGATPHFDYVAGEAAKGVGAVALEVAPRGVAVVFGILTTDSIEQALERAGTKAGNKGFDAAMAAVETVHALRTIPGPGQASAPRPKRKT